MNTFQPRQIIDPKTKQPRIVSVKEQQFMLENGILFDLPSEPVEINDGQDGTN